MSENEGAAAPATEQAQTAPTETKPATAEQSVQTDAATQNAETPENQEQEQPKRRSTSDRYRRKISAQAGVIERLASELEQVKASRPASGPELPKPTDYPQGEFDPQYVSDLAAIKAEHKIGARLDERDKRTAAEREREAGSRAISEFEKHAEKLKTAIPDFDETIESFVEDGGSLAPHVARRLQKLGEKGPMVAYHLAKNPELVDDLNGMSAEDAAFELASIVSKVSLPQPKKQTQAPAPLSTLKGGASQTTDLAALAKSDDATAFVTAFRKGGA